MSLDQLFTSVAELICDPDNGFGKQIKHYNNSEGSDPGDTFDGVIEILGNDPLVMTSDEEAIYEHATIEVPTTITVTKNSWFLAKGLRWNFIGRGGRDANLQTINVQSAEPISKKSATRR